jgi:hypothetical protein
MACRTCKNPLHIKEGGPKIVEGKIINVHVMACMNPDCPDKMVEQDRVITEVPSFEG